MKKKALVDGPTGCLDPIKDNLHHWIFELRECGHTVDRAMVSTKASVLLHSFGEKSDAAKYAAVKRFLDRMSLVYRMGTKESQRPPKEVGAKALDFIESAHKKVALRNKRFIINMDQMPVFFDAFEEEARKDWRAHSFSADKHQQQSSCDCRCNNHSIGQTVDSDGYF